MVVVPLGRMSVTAALVALTAAGCGAAGQHSARIPSNPCSLVTVREVEAATHGAVIRTHVLSDAEQMRASDPNPCEYETDGPHGAVSVYVVHQGAREFLRARGRAPENTVDLNGLGDAAFVEASSAIYVRVRNDYFLIGSQKGAGASGSHDLQRLAEAALANLSG